jgi:hypothetical protein
MLVACGSVASGQSRPRLCLAAGRRLRCCHARSIVRLVAMTVAMLFGGRHTWFAAAAAALLFPAVGGPEPLVVLALGAFRGRGGTASPVVGPQLDLRRLAFLIPGP